MKKMSFAFSQNNCNDDDGKVEESLLSCFYVKNYFKDEE